MHTGSTCRMTAHAFMCRSCSLQCRLLHHDHVHARLLRLHHVTHLNAPDCIPEWSCVLLLPVGATCAASSPGLQVCGGNAGDLLAWASSYKGAHDAGKLKGGLCMFSMLHVSLKPFHEGKC